MNLSTLKCAQWDKTKSIWQKQQLFGTKAVHNSPFNSRRIWRRTMWRMCGSVCGKPVSVCHQRCDTDDTLRNSDVFLIECSWEMCAIAFTRTISSISRGKLFIPWKQNSYTNFLDIVHLHTHVGYVYAYMWEFWDNMFVIWPVRYHQLLLVAWCCYQCHWKFYVISNWH